MVCALVAALQMASAISCIAATPERANPARLRVASRAASAGAVSGPNKASDRTRVGCLTAKCWAMMVPIE
ncbi:hypothetical protein D3C81_1789720 [compost metagenome]